MCLLLPPILTKPSATTAAARRDHRPRQPAQRLGIVRRALQDLRIERGGAAVVARLGGFLRHRQRLLDRRGTGLTAAEALNELLNLALRHRADKAVDRPPVLEGVDRRDRL